jgi:hypothetical protein
MQGNAMQGKSSQGKRCFQSKARQAEITQKLLSKIENAARATNPAPHYLGLVKILKFVYRRKRAAVLRGRRTLMLFELSRIDGGHSSAGSLFFSCFSILGRVLDVQRHRQSSTGPFNSGDCMNRLAIFTRPLDRTGFFRFYFLSGHFSCFS